MSSPPWSKLRSKKPNLPREIPRQSIRKVDNEPLARSNHILQRGGFDFVGRIGRSYLSHRHFFIGRNRGLRRIGRLFSSIGQQLREDRSRSRERSGRACLFRRFHFRHFCRVWLCPCSTIFYLDGDRHVLHDDLAAFRPGFPSPRFLPVLFIFRGAGFLTDRFGRCAAGR